MKVENQIVGPMLLLKVFVNWHQGDIYGSLGVQKVCMYLKTLRINKSLPSSQKKKYAWKHSTIPRPKKREVHTSILRSMTWFCSFIFTSGVKAQVNHFFI